ncbi:MAG: SLATT domain-containing protein [Methanomassiliicoccales archaeon]
MTDYRLTIIDEAKRSKENCIYSAKGHFNTARLLLILHYALGIPIVVFAALINFSQNSNLDGISLISILAVIVIVLTAITTFVNPNKSAANHQQAGNEFLNLNDKFRILAEIDGSSNKTDNELRLELEDLITRKDELRHARPTDTMDRLSNRKERNKERRGGF